jgi:transcriptional regulator with XRE-family HTH domain
MIDDPAAFRARLSAFRRSAGLSQEELASRSGLSVRAICNLECGRTRWPYPKSVRRLADALELRGEAREEFSAAARRRPVHEQRTAIAVPEGGQAGPRTASRWFRGNCRRQCGSSLAVRMNWLR